MEETDCPICQLVFDYAENRKPIRCLQCTKPTCFKCWSRYYEDRAYIICSFCHGMMRINPSSLQGPIKPPQRPCSNHITRESNSIDMQTMDFLCSECAGLSLGDNIKPLNDSTIDYLKKRLKSILNDTERNIPDNLVLMGLKQSKQNTKFSDLRNLIKEILKLTENNIKCSVHREKRCTKVASKDKILFCDLCETRNYSDVHPISEWVKYYFNYICKNFDLFNLLPFFVKKKRDIAKSIIRFEEDIDRETYMWIFQILEQFKINKNEMRFPRFYTKCPDCYENFSLGRKLPVLVPCQSNLGDPKHYVCFDCWERMVSNNRVFCILDDKELISDSTTQFVEDQWLDLDSLTCKECEIGYPRKEKLHFLPCNHMMCSDCVQGGIYRCKLCKIKFPSNIQLKDSSVIEQIQSYFYLHCEIHNAKAIKIHPQTLETACAQCPPKNGSMSINIYQIQKRVDNVIEDIKEESSDNEEIINILSKAPVIPLMDKIRIIIHYMKYGFIKTINSSRKAVLRFNEIYPREPETIEKNLGSRDVKCEFIWVRTSGKVILKGLILGGPVRVQFINVNVQIQLLDQSMPLEDTYSLTEKRHYIHFNDILIEGGFSIYVRYPGSDAYYIGNPNSRVEELKFDNVVFEVLGQGSENGFYQNDRGGRILGWVVDSCQANNLIRY